MTKAKAKMLVAELIERDLVPSVREIGGNYLVSVASSQGASTAAIEALVALVGGIAASVKSVEFS